MNSWCKIENGVVVDGPRAWTDNTPPDDSWLPHRLEDTEHTINDNYVGSHHEVRDGEVVEVKDYEPKSAEQIADEIQSIKDRAASEIAFAETILANPELGNRNDWVSFKDAWSLLLNVTQLSWGYHMPARPE